MHKSGSSTPTVYPRDTHRDLKSMFTPTLHPCYTHDMPTRHPRPHPRRFCPLKRTHCTPRIWLSMTLRRSCAIYPQYTHAIPAMHARIHLAPPVIIYYTLFTGFVWNHLGLLIVSHSCFAHALGQSYLPIILVARRHPAQTAQLHPRWCRKTVGGLQTSPHDE